MSEVFLVVDDDNAARGGFAAIFKHLYPDSSVIEACNGEEALELYKENPGILLIFTDHQMPKMTGIDLTKNIRLSDKKVKIIVASGYDDICAPALEAGANAFIAKPPTQREIVDIVRDLLETEELEE